MKWKSLNSLISFLFLVFSFKSKVNAQEHFIYLQTDAQQTFKAQANGKNYTSSSIGFLIIPRLKDSTYNIGIDLAGDTVPHLNFIVTVNKKDAGYQLRNFGVTGWGLFNMQTMNIIREGKVPQKTADTAKTVKKNTDFGDMLSDVVNDSTLNKPAPEIKRVEEAHSASSEVNDTVAPAAATMNAPVTPETNNAVTKVVQESTDTGTHAVFVDLNNPNDTVNVFIPSENASASTTVGVSQTTTNAATTPAPQNNIIGATSPDTSTGGNKTVGNPFYSATDSSTNNSNKMMASDLTVTKCKNMADAGDLSKLQKKIITETDADIMIVVAKKQLKGKCVTTDQVKTIGALFVTDEARYNFYEAMYNSTYDHGNYHTLQSQLLDPYYKKRFQTLLR